MKEVNVKQMTKGIALVGLSFYGSTQDDAHRFLKELGFWNENDVWRLKDFGQLCNKDAWEMLSSLDPACAAFGLAVFFSAVREVYGRAPQRDKYCGEPLECIRQDLEQVTKELGSFYDPFRAGLISGAPESPVKTKLAARIRNYTYEVSGTSKVAKKWAEVMSTVKTATSAAITAGERLRLLEPDFSLARKGGGGHGLVVCSTRRGPRSRRED